MQPQKVTVELSDRQSVLPSTKHQGSSTLLIRSAVKKSQETHLDGPTNNQPACSHHLLVGARHQCHSPSDDDKPGQSRPQHVVSGSSLLALLNRSGPGGCGPLLHNFTPKKISYSSWCERPARRVLHRNQRVDSNMMQQTCKNTQSMTWYAAIILQRLQHLV